MNKKIKQELVKRAKDVCKAQEKLREYVYTAAESGLSLEETGRVVICHLGNSMWPMIHGEYHVYKTSNITIKEQEEKEEAM